MIDYDGITFRALSNTAGGDVDGDTRFHYRQSGDVVWGTYAGGAVRFGTLVARVDAEGRLDMRYQHVDTSGRFRAGRCASTPERLPDGRLRLHERWTWTEGGEGSGESSIEQIAASDNDDGA